MAVDCASEAEWWKYPSPSAFVPNVMQSVSETAVPVYRSYQCIVPMQSISSSPDYSSGFNRRSFAHAVHLLFADVLRDDASGTSSRFFRLVIMF
jgi:hypothetical protein